MSKLNTLNALAASVVVSALGVSVAHAAAAANPFAASDLVGGYQQLAGVEGSCGSHGEKAKEEGKCGDKAKKEGKCGEGKCGADKAKAKAEGKCGEGKCGADKAKAEGKCGGEKAMEEGKCGDKK